MNQWFVRKPKGKNWTLYNNSRRVVSRHINAVSAGRQGFMRGAKQVVVTYPGGNTVLWMPPEGGLL
jgi:hypothetical protein